jgi:hypothetical protein
MLNSLELHLSENTNKENTLPMHIEFKRHVLMSISLSLLIKTRAVEDRERGRKNKESSYIFFVAY